MTMAPLLVVPSRTGERETNPVCVTPPITALTLHVILRTVGTPAMEKDPSRPVVPTIPRQVTVAPATGVPALSTISPATVVPGSGITLTLTSSAVPVLPPRSTAEALRVREETPTGMRTLNWYGEVVTVDTTLPLTSKLTAATAISSLASTATGTVLPSITVLPGAGAVMRAVGGIPLRSSTVRYWPMKRRLRSVVRYT